MAAPWQNISDGFFGGSIGAMAVSPPTPTCYTWRRRSDRPGQRLSRHRHVQEHRQRTELDGHRPRGIPPHPPHSHPPRQPDIVYAAVLGDLFADSDERGVYKSTDGGESWERMLFANERAGAVDLVLIRSTPRSSTPAPGTCGARPTTSRPAGRDRPSGNPRTAAPIGPPSWTWRACRKVRSASSA